MADEQQQQVTTTTTTNAFNFSDLLNNDPNFEPIMQVVNSIMQMPEENLNDTAVDVLTGMVSGAITPKIKKDAADAVLKTFRDDNYTLYQVHAVQAELAASIDDFINELHPSEVKKQILQSIFYSFNEIYEMAAAAYTSYDLELPIKLDDGALMPTYANDYAACADLYAREDHTILAHTYGNRIDTGVHLGLDPKWFARIYPRSGMSAKTPLRLSNAPVIDSDYRGPIILLFDNFSDEDYTIHAGDRIAQMALTPVHQFLPKQVDILDTTERGEQGLGSTGR